MKQRWPIEPGEYIVHDLEGWIAVCTMEDEIELDTRGVALEGRIRTENLGVERIIVNIVSNPGIRYLIVCGREIRGHCSGQAVTALWRNGLDEKGRIKGAVGALPYIQNIPREFVDRFRKQVKIVDLLDVTDLGEISRALKKIQSSKPRPYSGAEIDLSSYLTRGEEVKPIRQITCKPGNSILISQEYGVRLNPDNRIECSKPSAN